MKRVIYIIAIFSFFCCKIAICQRPDLSQIKDSAVIINTWLAYCDSIKTHLLSHAFQNNNPPQNLTSIALEGLKLSGQNNASARAQFYAYAAQGFFYENPMNGDSVKFYFTKSFQEAEKSRSAILITNATVALMHISFEMEGNKNAEYLKNILQSITDTTKDKDALAKGYAALGNFYQHKSYYSTAQDYYIKSILILKNAIDNSGNAKAKNDYVDECYTLAQLYLKTGSPDQALGMLREGDIVPGISPLIKIRNKGAFIKLFSITGQIDSALIYFEKYIRPLEIQFSSAKEAPYEIILSNLSIGEYYLNKGLYQQAYPFIEKGNNLGIKSGEPVFIYEGQVLAGKYYFKTGDFKKAVEWLSRALPIAKQFSKEDYAEAIKYMGLSLQAEGKDGDAIKYFSEYSSILDSITAKKISTNLADQATRYETGRKEIRIKFLDNENRVRNLELQKASRTRLILIISLCGLGIISLLLYSIYSNREKMNIQLNDRNVQLDKVNNELSVANETKATLFGIIAHDLRAPVSKIVQMIHLQKANPTINGINATEDFSERINEASENVLETMEDLLLWSKSQMKNFKPQFRMVNINHLIRQEINLFKEEINDKKLLININTDQQISYRSDENFLAVIIRNLLQNAIKNSSEGKVINIEILKDQIVISNNCNKEEVNKLNLLLEQKNISSQYSGFGLQMAKGLANQIGLKIYFKENGNDIISVVVEGLENLEES